MFRPIAFVVAALCVLGASAHATVPSSITVQGKLTEQLGAPLPEGDKEFVFRIFDASVGGVQFWPPAEPAGEIQMIHTDANGLWAALLGILHPLNEGALAGTEAWLEVTVDGTTLPRTQLVSVPYALKISTVDGAYGGVLQSKLTIGPTNDNLGTDAFVAGDQNTVSGEYAVIDGGQSNTASGQSAVVGGGEGNIAGGNAAVVGGGQNNRAWGENSTIGGGGGSDPSDSNATFNSRTTIAGGARNVAYDGSFIGGGEANSTTGQYSVIAGGNNNTASGVSASIGGGEYNVARGNYATVGGGGDDDPADSNAALANRTTIGGGSHNLAIAVGATIAGGSANTASGPNAAIGGGGSNIASASQSTVAGGNGNRAEGIHSFVGGGIGNIASGPRSAVSGGGSNRARGDFSTIGGGGGFDFADSNSAKGSLSTISGGRRNRTSETAAASTIAGGEENIAAAQYSAIGGGQYNITEGIGGHSTIGGGYLNTANGAKGTVGGGESNTAGDYAVVSGGLNNSASNTTCVISGGNSNIASGHTATVPGGTCNSAVGNFSFAAGQGAKANHLGSFVWNSTSCLDSFATTADRQFLVRCSKFGINTNTPATTFDVNGDIHASGAITATTCCTPSDTRFKQDIRELNNPLETVERLHGVRYQWNREQFPDRDFAEGEQVGLIAQEVQKVVPQAVHEMGDGYLAVDYARLVPLLIEGMKEQQRQIDELKSTIKSMSQ